MKYEQQIDAAFVRLGFSPRDGQREAVDKILTAFIDEKAKNVILNASTGTGKSIIAAATAEALTAAKGGKDNQVRSSISLTATNVLSKQYDATFHGLGDAGKYIMIKGANNYGCSALSTAGEQANAEQCAWFTMLQNRDEFSGVMRDHCDKCEYLLIKKQKNLVRHLTTNYSYYFVDRMYTGKFENRDLLIWDEAHLVNDLFSEHNAIYFSQKRMHGFQEEIAETVGLTNVQIAKTISSIAKDLGIKGKICESNYMTYLTALQTVYSYARDQGAEKAEYALHGNRMKEYSKYNRFMNKYRGLCCKISDLFEHNFDHIFEYKEEDKSVSIKPIFVGTMIDSLQSAEHNLFMSATISEEFAVKTLNLDPTVTRFIKLPPSFPKENKEVVFFDTLSLSYTSLQDAKVVKQLRRNVAKIVKKHVEEGDRGIILTPSFKLQGEIVDEISSIKGYKLFEQRQGEKLENVLVAFKSYKGGPAVLISPSLFEGVDLPGDLSRFQIIVKAPYPSLGDKRMKFILDKHPSLYNIITIMKLTQGAGRSVRSKDDFAVTYMLDKNAERLFTSSANIWRDEFQLRFTKFL